jgi:hypothetical protein
MAKIIRDTNSQGLPENCRIREKGLHLWDRVTASKSNVCPLGLDPVSSFVAFGMSIEHLQVLQSRFCRAAREQCSLVKTHKRR